MKDAVIGRFSLHHPPSPDAEEPNAQFAIVLQATDGGTISAELLAEFVATAGHHDVAVALRRLMTDLVNRLSFSELREHDLQPLRPFPNGPLVPPEQRERLRMAKMSSDYDPAWRKR